MQPFSNFNINQYNVSKVILSQVFLFRIRLGRELRRFRNSRVKRTKMDIVPKTISINRIFGLPSSQIRRFGGRMPMYNCQVRASHNTAPTTGIIKSLSSKVELSASLVPTPPLEILNKYRIRRKVSLLAQRHCDGWHRRQRTPRPNPTYTLRQTFI